MAEKSERPPLRDADCVALPRFALPRLGLRREGFRRCQDLREEMLDGPFDLILCRNLAFTYFGEACSARSSRPGSSRAACS